MNRPSLLESIRAAIMGFIELLWMVFAFALDLLRDISPMQSLMVVVGITGVCLVIAALMQRRLVKNMLKHPDEPTPIWRIEIEYSAIGILLKTLALPARAVQGIGQAVGSIFRKKSKEDEEAQKKAAQQQAEEDAKPLVVATLGPSYLWGGIVTAGVYLFALVTEPLIRLQIGAPAHYPGWQYLLFGHRRELAWYLPLDSHPYMAVALATAFWFFFWWWSARMARLIVGAELGRNLVKDRENMELLSSWREYFGTVWLAKPDPSYLKWSRWFPFLAIPFLFVAWASTAGDPYRLDASMFAVTLVLWASWGLHFYLEGYERLVEEVETIEEREAVQAAGWRNVMQDLHERVQAYEPLLARPPRRVEELPFTRHEVRDSGVLSPLLTEILPAPKKLTPMQHALLTTVSLQAYVHTEPPVVQRELRLDPGAKPQDQAANMRHRNQIVLAPEGTGKTTLAMLAACNHALVHTQGTLIIARDDERAAEVFDKLRQTLMPSTLRWNIRVRKAGGDLVNDFSQGIIPDIIVCSLRQLVVNLLDNVGIYRPFLENLGLIIIDEVEAFCGPVEIHAQLAFRRLGLRVRELLDIEEFGEEHAPIMLVLGTEAMQDMASWVRSLCGIDAVARHFAQRNEEIEEREAAQLARLGIGPDNDDAPLEGEDAASFQGRYHRFYRLGDFRTASGEKLDVFEIIASCERLAVPWHYRPCGDERRHLGRRLLALRDEPEYYVEDPVEACVVFLEGNFSAVEREVARLSRAGSKFSSVVVPEAESEASRERRKTLHPEPIAMITLIDGDEEMAFTEYNTRSPLWESIVELPRPIVRAPSGRIVNSHIASDLVNHWIELADFLDVFGHGAAQTVFELSKAGLLLTEPRVDVGDEVQEYEQKLYVRALATATEKEGRGARDGQGPIELPAKVSQVELSSPRVCAVRDRTNLNAIAEVDAGCANLLYYPGRIFDTAQGRFIVAGSVGDGEAEGQGELAPGDVLVEPYLGDELSSPRRRSRVELTMGRRGEAFFLPEPVLMGRFPIQVGLSAVQIRTDHVATYRLGPDGGEIRQRILRSRREVEGERERILGTEAVAIYPNPASLEGSSAPMLTVEDARLVAAAMRSILATMYRGAGTSVDVALHIDEEFPEPSAPLSSTEGFFIYDLHVGGNGAARAIHRDGVELVLRLVRMYLERVLYHDRLIARFDHWGTESEVIAAFAAEEAEGEDERTLDRRRRRRVLTWLDSRLRPEGRGLAGAAVGQMSSGQEAGEGDLFDIGRAWYSPDGRVTDLVWARHRWRLDERREAACDVGFDRQTLSIATHLRYSHEPLKSLVEEIRAQGKNGALALEDGSFWGMPRTVWTLMPGQDIPVGSHGELVNSEDALKLLANANAMAIVHWATLGPLAELFLREFGKETLGDDKSLEGLATYLARFVQGIPNAAIPTELEPRSPVHTLLYRLGTSDAQSLLLAMLLKRCGIDAGLFYSPAEKRILAGAAIQPREGVEGWARHQGGKEAGIVFWSESPARPGSSTAPPGEFVPIDPMQARPLGRVITVEPEGWVFLPLGHAWERVGVERVGGDEISEPEANAPGGDEHGEEESR